MSVRMNQSNKFGPFPKLKDLGVYFLFTIYNFEIYSICHIFDVAV